MLQGRNRDMAANQGKSHRRPDIRRQRQVALFPLVRCYGDPSAAYTARTTFHGYNTGTVRQRHKCSHPQNSATVYPCGFRKPIFRRNK